MGLPSRNRPEHLDEEARAYLLDLEPRCLVVARGIAVRDGGKGTLDGEARACYSGSPVSGEP